MCRWITLISTESVSLSDLILAPSNSLIHQSRDATFHPGYGALNNSPMNGDGFGVGWYHTNKAVLHAVATGPSMDGTHDTGTAAGAATVNGTAAIVPASVRTSNVDSSHHSFSASSHHGGHPLAEPYESQAALFKDTFPAWNNTNLRELCMATASDCVMAHVRAASPNSGVSLQNCHPFKAGRLLFCHNGRVYKFANIRRSLLSYMDDESFASIRGTTDSECVFGLILAFLAKDQAGISPFVQTQPFGAMRLVAALKKTLWLLETVSKELGTDDGYSTLNFSITDGETMVTTRFCDQSPEVPPPSLYFVFGEARALHNELTKEEGLIPMSSPHFTSKDSDSDLAESPHNSNGIGVANGSGDASSDTSVDSSSYGEQIVSLDAAESKPGRVLADVDPNTAAFIVTSNPLTAGHVWHKMPQNSIMWCTRGSHPELRLLQRRKHRYSVMALKIED